MTKQDDKNIQKMREMGFPEEMITFEPVTKENLLNKMKPEISKDLVDTLDYSSLYPSLMFPDHLKDGRKPEQKIKDRIESLKSELSYYETETSDLFERFSLSVKQDIKLLENVLKVLNGGDFE